jgi:hypothetical protein
MLIYIAEFPVNIGFGVQFSLQSSARKLVVFSTTHSFMRAKTAYSVDCKSFISSLHFPCYSDANPGISNPVTSETNPCVDEAV